MDPQSRILVELFRHNLWANAAMVDACGSVSSDQLATEVSGTYGRLDHTLIHLARAQGGYVKTLAGWQPGPEHRLEYDEPFPGTKHIGAHLRLTGEQLIEVAGSSDLERVLEGSWGDEPYRYPAWVLLLHAAHHATEHRQQVATMLTSLGIDPPEPDPVAYWESTSG
jgi:uncharacterized damage-inducible protein DinB